MLPGAQHCHQRLHWQWAHGWHLAAAFSRSSAPLVTGARDAWQVVCAAKGSSNPFQSAGSNSSSSKQQQPARGAGGARTGRKAREVPKKKPPTTISRPLQVTLLEEGDVTAAEAPSWKALCSSMAGEWVGQYGAYTPWEGMPEPVWLDDNNKYLDWVFTRAVEHAGGEGDGPSGAEAQEQQQQQQRLVRKIGRGTSLEAVSQLAIPLEGSSAGSDEIDVEALSYNSEGVVMFDGGSYSAGPDFIGPPAFKMLRDEDGEEEGAPEAEGGNGSGGMAAQSGEAEEQELDEAPNTISIMEQCLVHRGSRTRVRVKATVSIGHADNGEVELSVMRLVLFKEVWAGPVGALALEAPREVLGPSPCTRLPRPTETQACGEWRCTTTSAVSTEGGEQQAEGQQQAEGHWQAEGQLQTEAAVAAASAHGSGDAAKDGVPPLEWSYSVSEDVQLWELPGRDGPEEGADGGMLWLPGGVLVSFRMFAVEEEEEEAEESEEGGERGSSDSVPGTSSRPGLSNGSSDGEDEGPPPRGFCLGLTWLHDAGQALAMERYYDEEGCLRDVRCTVAAQQQQREWRGQGGG